MSKLAFWKIVFGVVAVSTVAHAELLEKVISREDPKFDCAAAVMTVGRDGNVYLSSVTKNAGYILRVSRDGTQKRGGNAIYAMANAIANADGIVASANAHFNHSVNLYSSDFRPLGTYKDILANDKVGWDAPARVEAGASGDFYALDQHRSKIVRLSPAGKLVESYKVPDEVKPTDFRVNEATKTFVLRGQDRALRGISFEGALLWTNKQLGLFDVDRAGTVYLLEKGVMKRFDPDQLQPGEMVESPAKVTLPQDQVAGVRSIAVFGDELIVKRAQATELFQVYDLATGKQKRVVRTDHERVTAEFPSLVWTAGTRIPLTLISNEEAAQWHVWITTMGDTEWRELPWTDNQVSVPADLAGLYQLRIAPTLNPKGRSENALQEVIEVRIPDGKGTVSVWTPLNRVWWGRGEEITGNVLMRPGQGNGTVTLNLKSKITDLQSAPAALWSTNLTLNAATSTSFRLPAAFMAKLAPGRYELRAEMTGFTCVGQAIRIGPGLAARSPFRTSRYGDYDGYVSKASLWEFADKADAMLARSQALGVNQYINRIAAGGYPLAFTKDSDGLELERKLEARLSGDPAGVAPEKAVFGFPQAHVLGGYSAFGLREWLLLVGMDAALPIGTSTGYAKGQKPEEYAATIKSFTVPLMDFPAFAGWDWVANWWVTDAKLRFVHAPASAATTPAPAPRLPAPGEATPANDESVLDEWDSAPKANAAKPDPKAKGAKKAPTSQNSEQAEYEAAFKKANETGVWHPILDTVGDRVVGWQADAQQMFKDALHKVAPALSTSAAGPYRRPEVYPPANFANVEEVDLHFQAEQIGCPSWTAHAADYYKRPNKPAWIHPELWNDTGTGEQILPMSWLAIMRGVDGIGSSGNIPHWGAQPTDARSGYPGIPSVFRALNTFARQYGLWLTTLENADRIAIPVSYRHVKGDWWMGIGGRYFTRLWEAHMSCLYARQPATFIYPEDKPDLRRFKALLMVSQRFELDPALADMLAQAKELGLTIFTDGNCRDGLMTDSTPLGVSFDRIEKLKSMNVDSTYWPFSSTLLEQAAAVAKTLDAVVPPVGTCDQPEVVLSERRSGDARFVWVVNNTFTALDPGKLWRVQTAVATHTPVVAKVTLPLNPGEVVYDVFAEREVSGFRVQGSGGNGVELTSDLRFSHARLYAILPKAVSMLNLDMPDKLGAGEMFTWTAVVPGVPATLPLHVELRDAASKLIEERFTTTGSGTLTVPINAALPVTFSATELISGKTAGTVSLPTAHCPLPADSLFGPRLRDLAISPDGATALLNAFDWGQNLYGLDLASGKVRWTGNVGDHFAYAPLATPAGFAAQGFDFKSGEGYHLYQLSRDGAVQRRFALPGIPARFSGWAFPLVEDRISNFTAAPDGTWVAGAGNLALAVWSPDGNLLWSQNWSATDRTVPRLAAAGNNSLIVSRGMKLTAYEAQTGQEQWTITPDSSGAIGRLSVSADGRTVAASASTLSGRIFVLRDGKLVGTLPTGTDDAVVTADGNWVALTQGSLLKLYAADGSLRWTYQGDDTLRFPRLSSDGKRLAVGSELGTLYVFEVPSGSQRTLDLGALPVTAWLPDGDLVAATWMGTVVRFGGDLEEKWRVQLGERPQTTDIRPQTSEIGTDHRPPSTDHPIPTARLTSWSNADPTPLPLTPNLLVANAVNVTAKLGDKRIPLLLPVECLFDGQDTPPADRWLKWSDIGMIDSGWRGPFSLEIEVKKQTLRVTAMTFVEDPAYPESWMRDARLEYWNPTLKQWNFAQYLTSDTAIHSHKLATPVEASLYRLAPSSGKGWPASNLRLAEIVFHGETLAGSEERRTP